MKSTLRAAKTIIARSVAPSRLPVSRVLFIVRPGRSRHSVRMFLQEMPVFLLEMLKMNPSGFDSVLPGGRFPR